MRRECRERFSCLRLQWKPLVSDPGLHHGTYMTHVPWCMSGLLSRGGGENVPGIPGSCATCSFHIWKDAHWVNRVWDCLSTGEVPLNAMDKTDQYVQDKHDAGDRVNMSTITVEWFATLTVGKRWSMMNKVTTVQWLNNGHFADDTKALFCHHFRPNYISMR